MSNFYELIFDVLTEQGKTFQDLENAGVVGKNIFYQYKTNTPYLQTVIKIANYLNVSLDYLSNRTTNNNFKEYLQTGDIFYGKFIKLLDELKISQTKLSRDLNLGRSNFTYWSKGSLPKLNTLIEIANYLGCSIDDLLETV